MVDFDTFSKSDFRAVKILACEAVPKLSLIHISILPLRTFDWALESPVAEIMVYSYAAFMIFSGIFSILSLSLIHIW